MLARVSLIDEIRRLQSLINHSVLKVKRKELSTDCKGNITAIRTNICDHSLLARDNHALIQMVTKTETNDKAMIKVTLIMLDRLEALPCFEPMWVNRVS